MSDSKIKKNEKVIDISDMSMEELKEKYKSTSEKIEEINKKIEEMENKTKEENKGKIPLAELINKSIDFLRGDITQKDFASFGETISIRPYIPMSEKLRLISSIIFRLNNFESNGYHEIKIINMEKDLFFDVLLGGYAMIDVSDYKLKTYDNMDILYPLFSSFILQYCSLDYNMLKDMIKESLSIYHIEDLNKILEGLDYKEIEKTTKENERIINELQNSKELVKDLKNIAVNTNPGVEVLNTILQKEVKENLKAESKKEIAKKSTKENAKEITKEVKKEIEENKLENNLNQAQNETGKKRRGRPKKNTEKK